MRANTTREEWAWLATPSLLLLAVAGCVSAITDDAKPLRNAAIAVILCLPVAALSLWLIRRMARDHPKRAAIGMLAGMLVRSTVAVAGGCAVYLGFDTIHADGVIFWFWVLAAYLSTLAAEVFVLAKPGWVGAASTVGKG